MAKQASDRDKAGRFGPGNTAAVKPDRQQQSAELRSALIEAVTPADIQKIVAAIVKRAADGDLTAAKLLFDRVFGKTRIKPAAPVVESAEREPSDLPADHATFDAILKGVFDAPKMPVGQPAQRTRTRKAAR